MPDNPAWRASPLCAVVTPAEADALLVEYIATRDDSERKFLRAEYDKRQSKLPGLELVGATQRTLEQWRADLFYPAEVTDPHRERRKGLAFAAPKAVCAACTGQAECLTNAMDSEEQYGVWGGLDQHERRSLRVAQRRVAS